MFHGRDAPLAYRNGSRRSRSMQGLAIRAALIFVSSGSRRYRRAHRSAQSSHRRPKRMSYERVGGALLVCLGGDHPPKFQELPARGRLKNAREEYASFQTAASIFAAGTHGHRYKCPLYERLPCRPVW